MTAAVAAPSRPAVAAPKIDIVGHVLIVVAAFAAATIAAHAVAGWYFIWDHGVFHTFWHWLVGDKALRNSIRDVAEGFFGGFAGIYVAWRHWRWMVPPESRFGKVLAYATGATGGGWLDRIESVIPLLGAFRSWGQRSPFRFLVVSCLIAVVFGAPGFIGMYYLLGWLARSPHVAHAHTMAADLAARHQSLWARTQSDIPANWRQKLMGIAASFLFGRHAIGPAMDDVQLWSAERHASGHRMMPWWLANYRYRVREARLACAGMTRAQMGAVARQHAFRHSWGIWLLGLATPPLALMGWLALTYAANGLPMPYHLNF